MPYDALHSTPLKPWMWWACTEPERPHDPLCAYDERCEWCRVKAVLAVRMGFGTRVGCHVERDGTDLPDIRLADWVKEYCDA